MSMTPSQSPVGEKAERSFTARIVELFITSKLSLLLLIASFLAGAAALLLTPGKRNPRSWCQ